MFRLPLLAVVILPLSLLEYWIVSISLSLKAEAPIVLTLLGSTKFFIRLCLKANCSIVLIEPGRFSSVNLRLSAAPEPISKTLSPIVLTVYVMLLSVTSFGIVSTPCWAMATPSSTSTKVTVVLPFIL